jgi:hypothetical protein
MKGGAINRNLFTFHLILLTILSALSSQFILEESTALADSYIVHGDVQEV